MIPGEEALISVPGAIQVETAEDKKDLITDQGPDGKSKRKVGHGTTI
jgi:hypothetical protein